MGRNSSLVSNEYFRIGQLASKTGVTTRTLRFYEEQGLLVPASRFQSGMRLYNQEDVERVLLIRQLQDTLGCSLHEIRELISIEYGREGGGEIGRDSRLEQAIELTRSLLASLSEKAQQSSQLRDHLEDRLAQYLDEQRKGSDSSNQQEGLLSHAR